MLLATQHQVRPPPCISSKGDNTKPGPGDKSHSNILSLGLPASKWQHTVKGKAKMEVQKQGRGPRGAWCPYPPWEKYRAPGPSPGLGYTGLEHHRPGISTCNQHTSRGYTRSRPLHSHMLEMTGAALIAPCPQKPRPLQDSRQGAGPGVREDHHPGPPGPPGPKATPY